MNDTSIGNTIKVETFFALPNGVIATGIIPDNSDGINIDNTNKLLMYVICKYSDQDWAIYCMRYDTVKDMYQEDMNSYIQNHGVKVTSDNNIKRVFNCSKKVLSLYTK